MNSVQRLFVLFLISLFNFCTFHSEIDVQKTVQEFKEKFPHISNEKNLEEVVDKVNDLIKRSSRYFQKLTKNERKKFVENCLETIKSHYPELFKKLLGWQKASFKTFFIAMGLSALVAPIVIIIFIAVLSICDFLRIGFLAPVIIVAFLGYFIHFIKSKEKQSDLTPELIKICLDNYVSVDEELMTY